LRRESSIATNRYAAGAPPLYRSPGTTGTFQELHS
jgi:hypothetical protein